MKTALVLLACTFALTGCVSTEYTGPAKVGETPAHLKRVSFFGDQKASKVDLINGTLEGYASEQAQVAGAIAGQVAGAVTTALAKTVKP